MLAVRPTTREAFCPFYPVRLPSEAYLAAKQCIAAEAEFQRMLDHWAMLGPDPYAALAHLQMTGTIHSLMKFGPPQSKQLAVEAEPTLGFLCWCSELNTFRLENLLGSTPKARAGVTSHTGTILGVPTFSLGD